MYTLTTSTKHLRDCTMSARIWWRRVSMIIAPPLLYEMEVGVVQDVMIMVCMAWSCLTMSCQCPIYVVPTNHMFCFYITRHMLVPLATGTLGGGLWRLGVDQVPTNTYLLYHELKLPTPYKLSPQLALVYSSMLNKHSHKTWLDW